MPGPSWLPPTGGPPDPVYAAVGVVQFESVLARLGGRGHDVPASAQYVRHDTGAWRGTCTRCGAVAETLSRAPGPATTRATRSHKKKPSAVRHEQKAAPRPYARIDVRLLVPCRGQSGTEGQPWPGRPFGGR